MNEDEQSVGHVAADHAFLTWYIWLATARSTQAFVYNTSAGVGPIPEMLFQMGDRLHLADLIAFCQFSTEFSLGLSLRHPGENEGVAIGWMDLHLTRNEQREEIYFRICLKVELTIGTRIDAIKQDCYRAPQRRQHEASSRSVPKDQKICHPDYRRCAHDR